MPLFIFNEVEVDGQDMNQDQNQPIDYTDNEDGGNQSQPEVQDNPEMNNGNPPQYEEQPYMEEPPSDYTNQVSDSDQQPGYDNGNEPPQAPPPQEQEEEQPVDELKAKEEEIYSNLTDEQLDIKHRELKTRFLDLYDMTSKIVDRIGDATVTEENIGVIEYISKNLSELRDMISDYVSSVYQTKSYTENSVNYNRFLAVLNGIDKMLEEINKKGE